MRDPYKGDTLRLLADEYPAVYCEVIKRPWLHDTDNDPHHVEPLVLRYLAQIASRDRDTAISVVRLPFLDTIEWGDADNMQFLA